MAVSLELQVGASNQAAAANNITFIAQPGLTFYLTAFDVSGLGATAASNIQITLTGTKAVNTPTYNYAVVAGVTTVNTTILSIRYGEKGFPASGQNTAVVVNVPSFGSGNTTANVVATGYYA